MAAYFSNSDIMSRRSRVKTDYIPGMFENVQSVHLRTSNSIALVQPTATGETCSSKAD